jgi:hypothetical protein
VTQIMSGYSGTPIFPAEDPYAAGQQPQPHPQQQPYPQQPQQSQQQWSDAEPTAMFPPVPPLPGARDEVQPPPSSRFGQIHEKYATTEVPLPPQLLQEQQAASYQEQQAPLLQERPAPAWPENWEQPARNAPPAATAPPAGWQPAQPQQQWADADQTAMLPPVPSGYPQPGQHPTPGQQPMPGQHLQPGQQPMPDEHLQPGQHSHPGQQPMPGQHLQPGQHSMAPHPGQHPQPGPQALQPQPWADAEQTAMLPPIPSAPFGAQPQPQPQAFSQQPPAQHFAQPQELGQPQQFAQTQFAQPQPQPLAEPLGPEATTAYAAPASLRETFAAAQPTGPAGAYAPPPPPPLEAQVGDGGSLRQAFAAAPPTGPDLAQPAAAAPVAPRRTGSPIIDPGIQPAAATAALAVLLALAALLGRPGLVLPVLLLQAVTAAGWFRLNGMWPARQGIALAALGGFTAVAAMLAASGGTAPAVLAGTLGGFFLLVLILQIFRPSNPDERFYALTVSASATVMTVLAGCFLAAGTLTHHGWSSGAVVTVGALSAGAATAVSALPALPAKAGFGAGAAAGLVAGALLGPVTGVGVGGGVLLGLVAGACALVGRRVAGYDFPSRFVHLTAGVVLPLTCAAPAVFLVGHLLAG